jgi:hypothetical protein
VRRHASIGKSYDSLRFASALASVIKRNPVHEESRASVGRLLRTAFEAFGASRRPDVVYLKSIYLFARDEGYPVKQEWLPSLSASDRETAAAILGRKVDEQSIDADGVARIRKSLEDYLGASTEIIIR